MAAYLSEILPRYNNGGATRNMAEARKACLYQAFRASLTLAALLYIGARDTAEGGGLALGQGFVGVETVSQADDLGLACAQDAAH